MAAWASGAFAPEAAGPPGIPEPAGCASGGIAPKAPGSAAAASATCWASRNDRRASCIDSATEPTAITWPSRWSARRPSSWRIRPQTAVSTRSALARRSSDSSAPALASSSDPTIAGTRSARQASATASAAASTRACAERPGPGSRSRTTSAISWRPPTGTPSALARTAASPASAPACSRMALISVRCTWRSRVSRCRAISRVSASAAAVRSISAVSSGAGGCPQARITRPQFSPRAPTGVTSQPAAASKQVPAAVTCRDRAGNPSSSLAVSGPAGSQTRTAWVRSSRIIGRPASRAASRTISAGLAPATDRPVNTSCSRAAARSSSLWLSMIRACTASVTSTNRTSLVNAISGRSCSAAAATSAAGSRTAPSSRISARVGSMAVVSTSRIRAAQAGSRPAPSRSGSATALRHVIHQARCHALCCSNEGVPGVRLEPMGELHDRHRRVIPNWVGLYYDEPLEIVSGKGSRVTDSAGRSYLDFFCGILTNMLGYDLPEVREAVERQLVTGVVHTSTLYLLRHQVELAEKIAELSGVEYAKVFFTNSGTEANETALLLATAARRSSQVLALRHSYHGRSFGAVAITGNRGWKSSQLTPFGVHYLHGTDRHLPAFARMSDADYVLACTEDLRHLLATATAGDVACLIAEPLQGVGGFAAPPDGLFAAYKEVLDSHGILFISDEVQTGWGRTGEHFWGISAHGFVPDMMTFAKGLGNGFAIGGVVARGELMDGLTGNGISTFGGNPIATAAAGATLDYVLSHDLQRNAATLGKLIIDGLREAAGPLDVAGDIRGKGLMFAVDLVDPVTGAPSPVLAARMLEETRARGLLIGKGGLYGHALRMAPPLTLTEAEAREGLGILVDALRAVDAGAAAGAGQAAGGGK